MKETSSHSKVENVGLSPSRRVVSGMIIITDHSFYTKIPLIPLTVSENQESCWWDTTKTVEPKQSLKQHRKVPSHGFMQIAAANA